ncbi:MAG: hypothetical protein RLZZ127_2275 [Planctomycetota bacterium]|jgi:hypothetical protein
MIRAMRISALLLAAAAAIPATAFAAEVPAGVPAAASAAAAVQMPAVNMAFARRALEATTTVAQACQSNLDVAKAAAAVPFAGDKAKKKVDSAQGALDVANGVRTDLTAISNGQTPAADGMLAKIAAAQMAPKEGDKPAPSPLDKLKAIPGAQAAIDVLSTPGVAGALVQALPLDKVPGYSTAAQALGLTAP